MIAGLAGSVMSITSEWVSAAQYNREPSALNVMSCESKPVSSSSSLTSTGASGVRMS